MTRVSTAANAPRATARSIVLCFSACVLAAGACSRVRSHYAEAPTPQSAPYSQAVSATRPGATGPGDTARTDVPVPLAVMPAARDDVAAPVVDVGVTAAALAPSDTCFAVDSDAVGVSPHEVGARNVVATEHQCRADLHPPAQDEGDDGIPGTTPDHMEFARAIGAALLPHWHHESHHVGDGSVDLRFQGCFGVDVAPESVAPGTTHAWVTSFTSDTNRQLFALLRVGTGHAASDATFMGVLHWTEDGHVSADALVPYRCTDRYPERSVHEVSGHRIYSLAGGSLVDDTPRGQVGLYRLDGHAFARVGVVPSAIWGREHVFVPRTTTTEAQESGARSALLRDRNVVETVDEYTFDGRELTPVVPATPPPASASLGAARLGPQMVRAEDVVAREVIASREGCSTALRLTPGDEAANAREVLAAAAALLLPASSWRGDALVTHRGLVRGCGGAAFRVPEVSSAPQITVVAHLRDHRMFAVVDIDDTSGGACLDHQGVMALLRWTDDGHLATEALSPWTNRCRTSLEVAEHVVGGQTLYEVPGGIFGTGAGLSGDVSLFRVEGERLVRVRSFTTEATSDGLFYPESSGRLLFGANRIFYGRSVVDVMTPTAPPPPPSFWRALRTTEVVDAYTFDGRRIAPARSLPARPIASLESDTQAGVGVFQRRLERRSVRCGRCGIGRVASTVSTSGLLPRK